MNWEKVKLGDVSLCIQPGPFGSQLHSSDYAKEGTPIVMPKDMIDGRIMHNDLICVPEEHKNRLKRHQVFEGDLLVARKGDVQKCVYIHKDENGWLTGSDCLKVSLDKSKCYPKFVFYQLRSSYIGKWLKTLSIGATMPSLNTGLLSSIPLRMPPITDQKKIACSLSVYDALIENNQRQIKLLEEVAQRLYKEWFVDLHFPGHENTKIADGVPDGWKRYYLGELIENEIGGGWGEDTITNQHESPAYVIRGTDMYGLLHGKITNIPYRYHVESNLKNRILSDGDVVFEVSGGSKTEGVARTLLIRKALLGCYSKPVICASFCKLIRFKTSTISQYMYDTFQYLRSSGQTSEFDKKSASSIVNYRWKDFMAQQVIIIPSITVLSAYNNIAEHLYNQVVLKSKMIEKIAQARDRLLPKLMSGEIEV